MNGVIPQRFLFRYRIPVRYRPELPRKGKTLLGLSSEDVLPGFDALEDKRPFAEIRAAWNPHGIGFSVHLQGKRHPPSCDAGDPYDSDGLQLWFDTRDTKTIHRAGRFCHYFCVLPSGGGKKQDQPLCVQLPIPQAREDAPFCSPDDVSVACAVQKDGYQLEVWFPGKVLHGYEPADHPLIGFYYRVRDAELGQQVLSVGDEFPFASDPSLWGTLELRA